MKELWYIVVMAEKKENGFDRLARLIKEEGEDIRHELTQKMDEGFSRIERRLDQTIQPQLDDHARRIKVLETSSDLTTSGV